MKKNYINPQMTIVIIAAERMIAYSEKLGRGMDSGGGGNNAEVKGNSNFEGYSNPVVWDDWE